MRVTITDKAQAIQSLANEADSIEKQQLVLAEQMGSLINHQMILAAKFQKLHETIKIILSDTKGE